MTIDEIISVISPNKTILVDHTININDISIDTRTISNINNTLFFAFDGNIHTSESIVEIAISIGVKNIVVQNDVHINYSPNNINILFVPNVLDALHKLAIYKRSKYKGKVIALSGSNGKTITKEWLFDIMNSIYKVSKSPKSYNSQIGVALAICMMDLDSEYCIIEAGISKQNEMPILQKMIEPDIGIFTHFGSAHQEGFENKIDKLKNKLTLFKSCKALIFNSDDTFLKKNIPDIIFDINPKIKLFTWGKTSTQDVVIEKIDNKISLKSNHISQIIDFKFLDKASFQNIGNVLSTLVLLKSDKNAFDSVSSKINKLEMRLELIEGIQNNIIINDCYSLDLDSLKIAINFQNEHSKDIDKAIILSQYHTHNKKVFENSLSLLYSNNYKTIILIGDNTDLDKYKDIVLFKSTEDFLNNFNHKNLSNTSILIKGARKYKFESIVEFYEKQSHNTVLEINLSKLKSNISILSQYLKPKTKIMLMLKAFGYGMGSIEISKATEHQKIDYFAVAYIDEAVSLRQNGIKTPILIMNSELRSLTKILHYNLEPEVFSLEYLKQISILLKEKFHDRVLNIHLKIETGMNRLGIENSKINDVIDLLLNNKNIIVKSIFSHLVGSEAIDLDWFTDKQYNLFLNQTDKIINALNYKIDRHILNTQGIIRHHEKQLDMVRIGIGMFGIDVTNRENNNLEYCFEMYSKITQIKRIHKNESIGYSRKGIATSEIDIAIINIGYADGYFRSLGNGNGYVYINKKMYPTIGNVCMDMIFINLGLNHNIAIGDKVELLGPNVDIHHLSDNSNTIPYEILTSIGSRVKRIYYEQ